MQHEWNFPYARTIETGIKQLLRKAKIVANEHCPEALKDVDVSENHSVSFETHDPYLSDEQRAAEYKKALKAVWLDGFITAHLLKGLDR